MVIGTADTKTVENIWANTAKDGTGTDYVPLVDGDGKLIMGASTAAIGTVTAVGPGAEAAAVSGNPLRVAGWNGTNAYTLKTDTSGQLILGAGGNAIGKLAAGTASIGDIGTVSTVTTVSAVTGITNALPAGTNSLGDIGTVTAVTAITNALPIGNNNIGDVDVASISAGTNYIGNFRPTDGTTDVTVNATLAGLNVVQPTTLSVKSATQDLSSAVLSYTTNFAAKTRILKVTIHASGATTETITITLDSGLGVNYDTVLKTQAWAADTDFFWQPDERLVINSTDEILVACTNGNGVNNVYVTVYGETVY